MQCLQGKTAQNEGHCVEWKGAKLVFSIGIPKALIKVLKEKGKYCEGMKLKKMQTESASCTDFKETN